MEMLTVKDVKKSFDGVEILKGISLTVEKGGVLAIIGPSGSGKSTLLRCITQLETRRCRGNFYLRRKPGKKLPYGNRGLFR